MEKLDLNYVAELIPLIRGGDMNAFAEFYAATVQRQYAFALALLEDAALAQTAIEDTYVEFLKTILRPRDDSLMIAWLTRVCFEVCIQTRSHRDNKSSTDRNTPYVDIDGAQYTVRRVMSLPLTEGLVLLMCYYCHVKPRDVARFLEIRVSDVRRYTKEGKHRLAMAPSAEGGAQK